MSALHAASVREAWDETHEHILTTIDLSVLPGVAIVYAYPRTGRPGVDNPDAWWWGKPSPDAAILVYGRTDTSVDELKRCQPWAVVSCRGMARFRSEARLSLPGATTAAPCKTIAR